MKAARDCGLKVDAPVLEHLLEKYTTEGRVLKACEPRDLLKRVTDVCRFHNRETQLSVELIDVAWNNYFGASYAYEPLIGSVAEAESDKPSDSIS